MHASSTTLFAILLSSTAISAPALAAPPPPGKDQCYREFDLAPARRTCTLRLASLDVRTRYCRLAAKCRTEAGGSNSVIGRHPFDDVRHLRNVNGVLVP